MYPISTIVTGTLAFHQANKVRIVFNKKLYPCRNISSGVLLYYICSAAHLLLLCFDVRPCFNRLLLVLLSLTSIILSGITGSISAPSGNKSCLCGNFSYINIWSFSAYTICISFCKTKWFYFCLVYRTYLIYNCFIDWRFAYE